MNGKALLTNAELEFTQRFQMCFPRGVIPPDVIQKWNGAPAEAITARILEIFKTGPEVARETSGLQRGLRIIADNIPCEVVPFHRDSFFGKDGPAKLYFWNNFKNWILNATPEEVPAFTGSLRRTQLQKPMYDSGILDELGHPKPFTILEFVAIAKNLISQQPNGETGTLLSNGWANIFYVQLEDSRVVAVGVGWDSDRREWDLDADVLVGFRWDGGDCVFSRS